MNYLKDYFLDRLREPSTWRGIVMLLTGLGVGISPELAESIVAVGVSLAGVIGVVTNG